MDIKKFKAGYSRIGIISVVISKCTICEQQKKVISIDSSEKEYRAGCICKDCALKAFEK